MTQESKTNPDSNIASVENTKLKQLLKEKDKTMIITKLQEKKLMYLIYLGIEKGYPLDKIYEDKVALISTDRFRKLLDNEEKNKDNAKLSITIQNQDFDKEIRLFEESLNSSQMFSFDASYEPITQGRLISKPKPSCIATLNLTKLSSYKSTERIIYDEFMEREHLHLLLDPNKAIRRLRSCDDIFLLVNKEESRLLKS